MYLRTDEEAEAANAMQMAARFSDDLERDARLWRWVIIALHNAAQGVMVLSLRHGNGLLALTDECFKQWMEAHENRTPYPVEKLDSYLNLYKKVKHAETGQIGGNQRFVAKGAEGGHIKRLNNLRNEFIHFTPKGWSLEVNGLPQICRDVSRLISFLGWETHNVFWHSEQSKAEAMAAHKLFVNAMQRLEEHYAKHAG
jgi:hypothetical protein